MNNLKNAASKLSGAMPKGGGPGMGALAPLIGLGAVGYGAYNAVYTVNGGECAIVWNRLTGLGDDKRNTGMHLKIPFFDYPIIFDVRTRPRNVQTLTGSKDLQMVSITLRVLTRPDVHFLQTIYRELGTNYDDVVLPVRREGEPLLPRVSSRDPYPHFATNQ
mmetsp:Transcript_35221/g.69936  ORF Transcript_35221/g.69936 Transcript_35221/m.69936 type:complete len:162 (-) Transcript_35221:848-1333(-)